MSAHVEYSISSALSGVSFSIVAEYSEDLETWSACTPDASDPDHDGVSGLAVGEYIYAWDVETDLGDSYNDSLSVRITPNNGTADGTPGIYLVRVNLLPNISISAPVAESTHGALTYIGYTLSTNRQLVTISLTVEYSIDDGVNWLPCEAETEDPRHDGSIGLTSGDYEWVWDSAADLTTVYQGSTVRIRITPNDGTNDGNVAISASFTIDMLPSFPTLISPSSGYFDNGAGAEFIFTVPSDPGSDWIVFGWEIDNDANFSSVLVQDDSVAEPEKFRHRQSVSGGYKQTPNGTTYLVRNLSVTSTSGTAVLFAGLINYHTELAIPGTLTNPQILITNKADRRCYVAPTSITATGFTIYKSATGGDSNGLVDLIIFTGASETYETYWVDLDITSATAYTLGVSPFGTDLLSNAIPGTITNMCPEALEGSDWGVAFSSITNTGFTVTPSVAHVAASAKVRVCLRSDPSEAYQHRSLAVNSIDDLDVPFLTALDDNTNGGAAWPTYLPGTFVSATHNNDRMCFLSIVANNMVRVSKSVGGIDDNGQIDLHGFGETDASIPYYTDVSPSGVPDTYEGNYVRYSLAAADTPAVGVYYWRTRAGNVS